MIIESAQGLRVHEQVEGEGGTNVMLQEPVRSQVSERLVEHT